MDVEPLTAPSRSEWLIGTLYLGHFSGPAEGIFMFVVIYLITAVKSQPHWGNNNPLWYLQIWDQGILTMLGLAKVAWIAFRILDYGLNEAFMLFGSFGLAFKVVIRLALHSNSTDYYILLIPSFQLSHYLLPPEVGQEIGSHP